MALYYLTRWLGILLLGLLVYGQTFGYGFVFDDYLFIVTNPFIKNFHNFPVMWHAFPLTRFVGMYSFALNYHFHQLNPQGYHIFNFLIHLICTGLAWALASFLFNRTQFLSDEPSLAKELPYLIALIFLVHPCQTQAVTYITQRFESLATMFYLAAILFYLKARVSTVVREKIILGGLAVAAMILGIMTKEVVVTLPAMMLIFEWVVFSDKGQRNIKILLIGMGFFLSVLLAKMLHAGVGIFGQSYVSESHDGDVMNFAQYGLTQLRVLLTFIRLLFFPIHQNLDYDYPVSSGLLHPPLTLLGLCVVVGSIVMVIKFRRALPLLSLGLAWMLITFSINLAPRTNIIFEHKMYLISFGFFIGVVAALTVVIRNRGTLIKFLFCIIAVLAFLSFQRNKVWANELSLWEDCIKYSPHKARVNASLGRVYGTLGRYDEAIYYLSRAIDIKPDIISFENRGVIYSEKGQYTQALHDLDRSLTLDPGYFPIYLKRAWVYQILHNYQASFADLDHAIALNQYYEDAYLQRGMLWAQLGRPQEAVQDFQHVLNIDPANSEAAQYKTYCLFKMR